MIPSFSVLVLVLDLDLLPVLGPPLRADLTAVAAGPALPPPVPPLPTAVSSLGFSLSDFSDSWLEGNF